MKNIIVKSLCINLALAMLLALAGCKKDKEVNSSQPTSSVESTVTSGDTTSKTDENSEKNNYTGYDKLNNDTAKIILEHYLNLQNNLQYDINEFFKSLIGKFAFDSNNTIEQEDGTVYYKTNIQYEDYETEIVKYMSAFRYKTDFVNEAFFIEENGYIYICSLDGWSPVSKIVEMKQEEKKDGKYTYFAKIIERYSNRDFINYIKATIIKENGIFVVDSAEFIPVEEVSIKNHTEINDTTAKYIIENVLNLETEFIFGNWDFCKALGLNVYEIDRENYIIEDEGESYETKYYKTNYKETDLEEKMYLLMTENLYSDIYLDNINFKDNLLRVKDGYLYVCDSDLYVRDPSDFQYLTLVESATLKIKKNGVYVYSAKCHSTNIEKEDFEIKATIINQNGNYVLDSYEKVK